MSRREFHCTEDGASKFWAVEVSGTRCSVQFGRLGTSGQTQVKEYPSEQAAKSAAEKLIAEKTRKGYAEVAKANPETSSPSTSAAPTPEPAPSAPPLQPTPPPMTNSLASGAAILDREPPSWVLPLARRVYSPRPTPAPFDLDACLRQFTEKVVDRVHWWNFDAVKVASVLTREEAVFWLRARTAWENKLSPSQAADRLAKIDYSTPVTTEELFGFVTGCSLPAVLGAGRLLINLITPEEIIDALAAGRWQKHHYHIYLEHRLAEAIPDDAFAHLPDARIKDLQEYVRRLLPSKPRGVIWTLAAYLGLYDEILSEVLSWPDDHPVTYCEPEVIMVFNLAEPDQVVKQVKRLKSVNLSDRDHLTAWLYRTGLSGLERARDAILGSSNRVDPKQLMEVFAHLRAPEVAPFMLEAQTHSKIAPQASAWLAEDPRRTVAGLLPMAGGRGKLAEAAVEVLRSARRKGLEAFIEEQLGKVEPHLAARVREQVFPTTEKVYTPFTSADTPAWLASMLALPVKESKAPDWALAGDLPHLTIGDRCLAPYQVDKVLAALRQSTLANPVPLIEAIDRRVDQASLDAFAWKLFQHWIAAGGPSKEKWAFSALGLFGSDDVALRLAPLLREWPGEGQHQRAVHGLECLRAIGTDTALTQLNGIAQKVRFAGLKNKAREFMEAIAAQRGLSKEQLEDRIVPDLDLDAKGGRTFDFGPRQFRVVIGPELKPMVREGGGKVKADLPAPGVKDDKEMAEAAVAEWKLLKKQLREAVKVQAVRLEQAMILSRRWTLADFETLLVKHPLQINLVRRLLWGGYDAGKKLVSTFRVDEDGVLLDEKDDPYPRENIVAVGLVHPLEISEAQRATWGQQFSENELVPPFPQLGRPVHHLQPEEVDAREMTRWKTSKVPGVSVIGTLEKSGWQRGNLHDHGDFYEYAKFFRDLQVTAVITVEPGLWAGNITLETEQSIPVCYFLAGLEKPPSNHQQAAKLRLGDVNPVVMSEVIAELLALTDRG